MKRMTRCTIVSLIVASLIFVPMLGTAFAYEEKYEDTVSAEKRTADLLLIRPVGIFATVTGGIVWALSLPFTWSEDRTEEGFKQNAAENLQKMVVEPSQHTFQRKLGDF